MTSYYLADLLIARLSFTAKGFTYFLISHRIPNMLQSILIFLCVFYWNHSIPDRISKIHVQFMEDVLWKFLLPRETQTKHGKFMFLCLYHRKHMPPSPFPGGLLDLASPLHQPWHKPQHWNTAAEKQSGNKIFHLLGVRTLTLAVWLQQQMSTLCIRRKKMNKKH